MCLFACSSGCALSLTVLCRGYSHSAVQGLLSQCCAGAFYESASTALIVIDLAGPPEQLEYVKAKIEAVQDSWCGGRDDHPL